MAPRREADAGRTGPSDRDDALARRHVVAERGNKPLTRSGGRDYETVEAVREAEGMSGKNSRMESEGRMRERAGAGHATA